ncbi:MAG: cupin domain-containing protein [Acutalibacteraceae bacterium]
MIKRADEMISTVKERMRGGDGQAVVTDIVNSGEYDGKARLIATITLGPGCSIGEHVHENEEEIFYIIKGEAKYNDNGTECILYQGDSCVCRNGQKHAIANNGTDSDLLFTATILTL